MKPEPLFSAIKRDYSRTLFFFSSQQQLIVVFLGLYLLTAVLAGAAPFASGIASLMLGAATLYIAFGFMLNEGPVDWRAELQTPGDKQRHFFTMLKTGLAAMGLQFVVLIPGFILGVAILLGNQQIGTLLLPLIVFAIAAAVAYVNARYGVVMPQMVDGHRFDVKAAEIKDSNLVRHGTWRVLLAPLPPLLVAMLIVQLVTLNASSEGQPLASSVRIPLDVFLGAVNLFISSLFASVITELYRRKAQNPNL